MVERIRAEMGVLPTVVATGGLAPLIRDAARTIQHVHGELALEGLRLVYERSR
jgi:type III pantothenate kinase